MGRHFEVRAASMAATAAKKSAIYMRASKEIYMAAIGKISLDEVKNLLQEKQRNITNYCYPPEGLYLVDVKY